GTAAPTENPSGLGAFRYNLRFPGQYFDVETGSTYNGARDYDASLGRFIEADPIGLLGGNYSPYAFVGNGPLDSIDPTGLDQHHTFPRANWPGYSQEAQRVFDRNTISTAGAHRYTRAHRLYNQVTKARAIGFCQVRNIDPATMTAREAQELV